MTELKILTMHPDVQSYFYYESSGIDKKTNKFHIYGYLLPRTEPYKYGAYRVCIILPTEFPFKPPILELLTYIYHPAIDNNISQPRFCKKCSCAIWSPGTRISQWLEQYVNIIEQPGAPDCTYCIRNFEAKNLYHQDRDQYEEKARAMVEKYSHLRPHRSIVSLKFAAKQIICTQLNFQSRKIDQLPLPTSLKLYLNLPWHKNEEILEI
jgi:ubiquitin-protein ligase